MMERLITKLESRKIDITKCYENWIKIGFALCKTFGEQGRGYYHRIGRMYPRYTSDETKVQTTGDGISLGQKQLIAFMRAILRKPELLILDEATANIDTVTEQLLVSILLKLPQSTTRVIIAHRLNTIENADEIFFVNTGKVIRAGSFNDAINLLLHGKNES